MEYLKELAILTFFLVSLLLMVILLAGAANRL